VATDSPDSKLEIAPPNLPVTPTGKANPRAPAAGKSAPAQNQNGGAAQGKAGAPQSKSKQAAGSPAAQTAATSQTAAAPAGKAAAKKTVQRQPKQPSSALQQIEELEKIGSLSFVTLAPARLISLIVHMVVLLLFGLLVMPQKVKEQFRDLVAVAGEKTEILEEELELPTEMPVDMELPETEAITNEPVENVSDIEPLDAIDANDAPAPEASAIALADFGQPTTANTDLLNTIGAVDGKGLAGRGDPNKRKQLAAANGGNDASEAAVAAALRWFAEHQNGDGSWSFDHRGGKCNGRCGDPGKLVNARLAATGLALLPFLGAGQTHKQGKYKETVRGGLYYLGRNMKVTPNGGDMTAGGGNMYGHGICSIALCEAYAMTQDRDLAAPAQAALNFIVYAQDPVGGGWRYSPRQPGDTSAVGWQLMALKSGHLAFLQVPPSVVKGATKFLDSVQADEGSQYGYTSPGPGAATSAVGLISRMYMGWEKANPALDRGVKRLAKMGPQISAKGTANMYFNYYASQVMHQFDGPDGPLWTAWNTKMRDTLVQTQSKKGHETGSWFFTGEHGSEQAGRLYSTSMATMTLEVYYRYMPIYSQKSADDGWD
jgi:hypothetical protein